MFGQTKNLAEVADSARRRELVSLRRKLKTKECYRLEFRKSEKTVLTRRLTKRIGRGTLAKHCCRRRYQMDRMFTVLISSDG